MSKEALAKVVQRAISDGAFRRQLSTDPSTALRGFDLTPDESAAIRSGDSSRLSTLGVDLRMSKAFSLASDQATGDASRPVLSNDLGASYTGASTVAGQGSAGSSATTIAGQGSAGSSADTLAGQAARGTGATTTVDHGSAGSSALTSGNQADHEAIISAGANAGRDQAFVPGEPAHALGDQPGDDYLTSVNVLTPGDTAKDSIIVIDDQGASGASTPGESSHGPTIQE